MPELCFNVSDMQQRAENLDVSTMVRANTVLRNAQQRARAGHSITYPAGPSEGLDPSNLVVLGVHDASFAQQPGGASQQGHIVFLALKETVNAKQGHA